MAIRADRNLYPGVNPHLNSFLQQPNGGWKGFHNLFLAQIYAALEQRLPAAYYVANEQSLQIGIYDAEYVASLVIYRMVEGGFPGEPVTRIELLSPANKAPGSDYALYLMKREETLYSGLRLVEIDLLHERRPILRAVPSYPDREANASPYSITINDPRPTFQQGMARIYTFGVLDPLPALDIPLDDDDTVTVDFGAAYHATVNNSRLFRSILVDYEQLPAPFDAYAPDDQQRIREFMAKLADEMA